MQRAEYVSYKNLFRPFYEIFTEKTKVLVHTVGWKSAGTLISPSKSL